MDAIDVKGNTKMPGNSFDWSFLVFEIFLLLHFGIYFIWQSIIPF
jgi:hypothetical protein